MREDDDTCEGVLPRERRACGCEPERVRRREGRGVPCMIVAISGDTARASPAGPDAAPACRLCAEADVGSGGGGGSGFVREREKTEG